MGWLLHAELGGINSSCYSLLDLSLRLSACLFLTAFLLPLASGQGLIATHRCLLACVLLSLKYHDSPSRLVSFPNLTLKRARKINSEALSLKSGLNCLLVQPKEAFSDEDRLGLPLQKAALPEPLSRKGG